ncbi:hypothetical protein JMJ55_28430 [Belnapia sp. T6]|uniref:Uncharacterized protein n=1 Tax=Belnapia mucosa TaxID=2804532 RepID=A0ABS1VC62_9PROT|nr:hypothetical protein [Belnapia mucosa]MBL6459254.1 hypothetical protein [Belnapia mucosa]
MAPLGRTDPMGDDWDLVWQEYDQRQPAPAARPVPARMRARRRLGWLLALSLGLALLPRPAALMGDPEGQLGASEALGALLSLAPEEAELPPLADAISRLAAESSEAACWVLRLKPMQRGCP